MKASSSKFVYLQKKKSVSNEFSSYEKTPKEVFFSLTKPIDGPQELELEFWFQFYNSYKQKDHIRGLRLLIYVTEH